MRTYHSATDFFQSRAHNTPTVSEKLHDLHLLRRDYMRQALIVMWAVDRAPAVTMRVTVFIGSRHACAVHSRIIARTDHKILRVYHTALLRKAQTCSSYAIRCHRAIYLRIFYRGLKNWQVGPLTKLLYRSETNRKQESLAVARKPRDAATVLFGLKFADNIHYKFKSSQASKARLQSPKHTGAKQNLTQNGYSRSFTVTCFGVSGKAIRY